MKFLQISLGKFRDLKLRTKLILSYIFLIAVPTAIFGFVYYNTSSDTILNSSRQNIYEIVKKNNQIIDIKLNQVQESAQNLILDKDLYEIFSKINSKDDLELINADRAVTKILDKYFSQYEDVYSTNLITNYFNFGKNTFMFAKENAINKTKLFSSALEQKGRLQWLPTYNINDMLGLNTSENLAIVYPYMFSAVKQLNMVSIETFGFSGQVWNSQTAFEMKVLDKGVESPVLVVNFKESVFRNIFYNSVQIKDSNYYVISRDGEVISSSETSKISMTETPVWLPEVKSKKSGSSIIELDGKKVLICYDTLNANGWISVVTTPVNSILSTLPRVRYYTLYLCAGITLVAILLSFIISGWIAKPLKKLLLGLKKISRGDFDTKIPVHSKDEIGLLIVNFNEMNEKIQNLIEENYETTIREKEAQIMALNLQLNPHFLSNTLNTINWMAIENNQGEISRMIINLSKMLQYTMNNIKETVRFEEDMEWLKSFVYIMSNRFTGLFSFEYDLDPVLNGQMVPKLFLQPFVENSIIHGFETMEKGGVIRITGRVEDSVIHIYIVDNGKGMTEEDIIRAKNADGESIGIKNIDKKIKLLYGEKYGVGIKSETGRGTEIEITMPFKQVDSFL